MKGEAQKGSAQPKKGGKFIKFLAVIVFLGAIAVAAYSMNELQKLKNDPNAAARQEVAELTARVGKLIELPAEEPSVATVLQKDELKDQPFFKNAENEDKVLIYVNEKKAILYRPSTNKIIEVMPLSIDNSAAAGTSASTTPSTSTSGTGTNTQGFSTDQFGN